MPGGDRTGPWGEGAGTGWGRGGCLPFRRGRGGGLGRNFLGFRGFLGPYSAQDEMEDLKAEQRIIEERLDQLEKQIKKEKK